MPSLWMNINLLGACMCVCVCASILVETEKIKQNHVNDAKMSAENKQSVCI